MDARSIAFICGPWNVRLNGSTDEAVNVRVSLVRPSGEQLIEVYSRSPTLLKACLEGCWHNDSTLRESECNRGTGCGKTARPGLCRGRRVTGVPTARRLCPLKPSLKPKNLNLFWCGVRAQYLNQLKTTLLIATNK
jgi:hypothetical protein